MRGENARGEKRRKGDGDGDVMIFRAWNAALLRVRRVTACSTQD